MTVRRGAMSLVEILIALAILVMSVGVIFETLSTTRLHALRTDVLVTGRLIAQNILGQVRHRVHIQDNRFYRLETPPAELLERALRGEWKRPFSRLSCARTPVVGPPDPERAYDALPAGLATARDADAELAFWKAFSYEVTIQFGVSLREGAGVVPIDSDGDGRQETDLALARVEVFFKPDGFRSEVAVCRLTTLLIREDRSPGAGALADL